MRGRPPDRQNSKLGGPEPAAPFRQETKCPRVGWAICKSPSNPEALAYGVYRNHLKGPGGRGSHADREQRHRADAAGRPAAYQGDLPRSELPAGLVRALPPVPERQLHVPPLWDQPPNFLSVETSLQPTASADAGESVELSQTETAADLDDRPDPRGQRHARTLPELGQGETAAAARSRGHRALGLDGRTDPDLSPPEASASRAYPTDLGPQISPPPPLRRPQT